MAHRRIYVPVFSETVYDLQDLNDILPEVENWLGGASLEIDPDIQKPQIRKFVKDYQKYFDFELVPIKKLPDSDLPMFFDVDADLDSLAYEFDGAIYKVKLDKEKVKKHVKKQLRELKKQIEHIEKALDKSDTSLLATMLNQRAKTDSLEIAVCRFEALEDVYTLLDFLLEKAITEGIEEYYLCGVFTRATRG